jgi:hypothetical protein
MSNSSYDIDLAACIEKDTRERINRLQEQMEKTFLKGDGFTRILPDDAVCERCGPGKTWIHMCQACSQTGRHPCPAKELA